MAVSDDLRILLMRDACREVVEISRGHTGDDLSRNRVLQLALTKLVENIGEEAANVSAATREAYPEIPWQDVADTRHRLVHNYTNIDYKRLWDIVSSDVPKLLHQLEAIAPEMNP